MPNFYGTPLNDLLFGSTRDDVMTGGFGDDILHSLAGDDIVFGNGGNDTVFGYLGDDLIFGGDGHDWLGGEQGNDTLSGGTGRDTLIGGPGNDLLSGDGQDDFLAGGDGADTMDGGSGIDTASYFGASGGMVVNLLYGTASDGDVLMNIENVIGSKQADILVGDHGANEIDGQAGNDILIGNGGDDTLKPGAGNDVVSGNSGIDMVSYAGIEGAGVTIDLSAGTAIRVISPGRWFKVETDTLSGIEAAHGSNGNDILVGDAQSNLLIGDFGDDTLNGDSGNDTLNGGSGIDMMTGGPGADRFVFTVKDLVTNPGPDWGTITDFSSAQGDRIDLSELENWYGLMSYVGTAPFSGNPGNPQLRIMAQTFGATTLGIDVDGDGTEDGMIEVLWQGFTPLSEADFIL